MRFISFFTKTLFGRRGQISLFLGILVKVLFKFGVHVIRLGFRSIISLNVLTEAKENGAH